MYSCIYLMLVHVFVLAHHNIAISQFPIFRSQAFWYISILAIVDFGSKYNYVNYVYHTRWKQGYIITQLISTYFKIQV